MTFRTCSQERQLHPPIVDVGDGRLRLSVEGTENALIGRPWVAWRPGGSKTFQGAPADITKHQTRRPGSVRLKALSGPLELNLAVSTGNRGGSFGGFVRNTADAPVEIARVHYVHGQPADQKAGFICVKGPDTARWVGPDEQFESHNQRRRERYGRVNVARPGLSEPIGDAPNWSLSCDLGILTRGWDEPGWVFGATGPGTAFGQVGFRTGGPTTEFFAGVTLEGITLEPGENRLLEQIRFSCGHWQDGIRDWARHCVMALGGRSTPHPPAGFCSWYQWGHRIDQSIIERATDEFADLPQPPGGRIVQLDDGYQRMPGDWRPNDRFTDFEALPQRIRKSGSVPGLWLAPTLIHEDHPAVSKHPDWLQRLPDGKPAVSYGNWGWVTDPDYQFGNPGSRTYYLETDHPDVQDFIRDIVGEAVDSGWKYLKLDFTNRNSPARTGWHNKRTTFESLRNLYRLFRQAAGPTTILNACIGGAGRYALGYADVARAAGDNMGAWDSVTQNLRAVFLLTHINGLWWGLDPDVFYLRPTNLTGEETFLLTGTIGLMGGVFMTSDLPSQWTDRGPEQTVLRPFWNDQSPETPDSHHLVYRADGLPAAYAVTVGRECRVGIYNWEDQPAGLSISLTDLRLSRTRCTIIRQIGPEGPTSAEEGPISLNADKDRLVGPAQPPHSLRIAVLEHEDSPKS